jgi:hypothetical protein
VADKDFLALKVMVKLAVFKPLKSLQIPAYTLMVDGVKQTTKPIEITYKKPTKTKAGDDYILEAKVDRKDNLITIRI